IYETYGDITNRATAEQFGDAQPRIVDRDFPSLVLESATARADERLLDDRAANETRGSLANSVHTSFLSATPMAANACPSERGRGGSELNGQPGYVRRDRTRLATDSTSRSAMKFIVLLRIDPEHQKGGIRALRNKLHGFFIRNSERTFSAIEDG